MECFHDKAHACSIFKGLRQHFGAAVRAGHVEPGLQEPNGVKSRSRCHVQYPLDATFFQDIDEKIPFAFGSGFPIDEFIPFSDKAMDVFTFVLVGFSLGDGVITVQLFFTHGPPPRWSDSQSLSRRAGSTFGWMKQRKRVIVESPL